MGNNKLARKIRRKKAKEDLKEAQKRMADAFSNIDLPDNCTLCQKNLKGEALICFLLFRFWLYLF